MSIDIFRFEGAKTDDTGDLQTVKGTGYAGEELDTVHRAMPFGLASHAPVGSHSLAVASRGQRTLVALLGLEHQQYRQKNLQEGQTVLYDKSGNVSRYLGADGIWHDSGSRKQKMTGDTLTCLGVHDVIYGSSQGKTYLGGDPSQGGTFSPVMTQAGPSSVVFAKV